METNPLLQRIIDAYEAWKKEKEAESNGGDKA